jgi:hypothetical protein
MILSMKTLEISLPKDAEGKIAILQTQLTERDQKITDLEEQLAWFQRQIFGKRSEKTVDLISAE